MHLDMGARERLRLCTRAIVFLCVSGFLVSGIVARQAVSLRAPPGSLTRVLPLWAMFSAIGVGVTQVRYFQRDPRGGLTELDRFALLGLPREAQPPRVFRVHGLRQAKTLGRRLCAPLGDDPDVRLHARTAKRSGWEQVAQGEENLCERPKRKKRRR